MQNHILLQADILEDDRLAHLPDHLWRRAFELLLLADWADGAAALPELDEMAIALHCPLEVLSEDLLILTRRAILVQKGENWYFNYFIKVIEWQG